jgi:hypothetical protein
MCYGSAVFGQARAVIFNLAALGLVGCIAWGLLQKTPWPWTTAIVALAAAGLCAVIANFEHFESFKATPAGIEAKIRKSNHLAGAKRAQLHELSHSIHAAALEEISMRRGGAAPNPKQPHGSR